MIFKSNLKQNVTLILRLTSFIPTIFMLWVIFSFSGQEADTSAQLSHGITYQIVMIEEKITNEKFDEDVIEQKIESIHFYVRKVGHITEFFLLGLSLCIPCLVYQIKGKKSFLLPIIFGFLFAGLDEFHQLFVPGRDGALRDVLIDGIGILLSIFLVQIFVNFLRCRKKKNMI